MMNYTNSLFADWYREADIQPTPQIITSRIDSINSIIEKQKRINFWLDIAKLYLGYNLVDNESYDVFCSYFKTEDPLFPLLENENLIRVLAAICLFSKLDNGSSYESDALSMALITSNFLNQFTINNKIPVREKALRYIEKDSIEYRKLTNIIDSELLKKITFEPVKIVEQKEEDSPLIPSDLDDPLTSLNNVIKSIVKKVDLLTEQLHDQKNINATLLEETNILWWVFGETSTLYKKHVKDIGVISTAFTAGYELAELIDVSPGYLAINPIIKKMLKLSSDLDGNLPDSSIYEVINSLSEEIRKKASIDKVENLLLFTPVILGINKSLDLEDGADWSPLFKKSCRADSKTIKNTLQIAVQVYYEFQFFKSYNLCSL